MMYRFTEFPMYVYIYSDLYMHVCLDTFTKCEKRMEIVFSCNEMVWHANSDLQIPRFGNE